MGSPVCNNGCDPCSCRMKGRSCKDVVVLPDIPKLTSHFYAPVMKRRNKQLIERFEFFGEYWIAYDRHIYFMLKDKDGKKIYCSVDELGKNIFYTYEQAALWFSKPAYKIRTV